MFQTSTNTIRLPLLVSLFIFCASQLASAAEPRWWKGNLHTHSLWSDGDDYPEMIADWYKSKGYHFLMFSEHNVIAEEERWSVISSNRGGANAFKKYLERFGPKWVEQKEVDGKPAVRLQPFDKFRTKFDEPGRFLLIRGEEITDRYKTAPVHMNAVNLRTPIKPKGGDSVLEIMQNNVNQVLEQRRATGQPMFPHINHPNFGWGVTAEELMRVKGERFFEVYNGHPTVYNEGDETHASMDRIWDIILARRLTELNLEVLYGVGTDDSHHYHEMSPKRSNSGRGWVMVRTAQLTPEAIVNAMEAGDFYASSGVILKDVRRGKDSVAVEIDAQPGVEYTIQFIGTRKGFDPKNEPIRTANGEALRVTHHYSKDIGAVLAEVKGTSATYKLKGDETYVRAKITSTKVKPNPVKEGETEAAWIQPLVTGVK
jgi:hypothetical protein